MHKLTVLTRDFIASLQPYVSKRLVFEYDGKRIQPGYHVTEIKAASFRSLDCGANPQQWRETIIQLWDVADKPEEGHMSVKKFLAIWSKVDADVGLDGDAEIKFECGDAITPAVHYTPGSMRVEGDALVASLQPVRATCKPRDRSWMDEERSQTADATSCCAPANNTMHVLEIADVAVSAAACCATDASCCN